MSGESDGPSLVDLKILSRLERDVGGEVVRRGIDLFLEQAPGRLEAVRAGARGADLVATADALHSIKSAAAMLGATALSEVADRGERLAREGQGAEVTELIDSFERTLARTIELLRRRRKELREST